MMKPAEITWSLLHPRKPEPAYVRETISAAAPYRVDSFELCGEAHLPSGSIDGAIYFGDYPAAAAKIDRAAVTDTIALLNKAIAVAHAAGRSVLYWHREVMVPRVVVASVPGLLDENGEFNLLGPAYHHLLRAKLAEFFTHVPQLDGVVLTLTESEYSVIHNSNPRRYPPADVVRAVITTFAEELHQRGKRFVLRSFGSIAQDYRDILAGAAMAEGRFDFEIETKITPYDFSPFLDFNPFLRRTGGARLSAEYDSIGEFLGAGYLPAPDPERVIAGVRHAQQCGVDRHVIRVDRIGHATFSSTQAINLLAYDRAIRDPGATADQIWAEWAQMHWPDCAAEMTAVMRRGIEMVKRTHFIDGHLIFHAFPIDPTMKWVKASGILSVFTPAARLELHDGMWGIAATKRSPAHSALLGEKDEAVRIADEGWRAVQALRPRLPEREYQVAEAAWRNATVVTRLIRSWCSCVCAYQEDMAAGRNGHPSLLAAITASRGEFSRHFSVEAAPVPTPASGSEYGGRERGDTGILDAYARPLWALIQLLPEEFAAEWAERAMWRKRGAVVDCIVCGGIADDHRVRRYMHASHARLIDGRPARFAGNRVFPNGFIECALKAPAGRLYTLVVKADPGSASQLRLTIDGAAIEAKIGPDGEVSLARTPTEQARVVVRIEKVGADYPAIFSLATVSEDPRTKAGTL